MVKGEPCYSWRGLFLPCRKKAKAQGFFSVLF